MTANDLSWAIWLVLALVVLLAIGFLLRRRTGRNGLPPEASDVQAIEAAIDPAVSAAIPFAPAIEIPAVPDVADAGIEVAAPPVTTAVPGPSHASPATSIDAADDLRRIKGIGPKIVAILTARGVTRYDQIAAWTDADLAQINAVLGGFSGRPQRDNWVDQARLLAAGDVPSYEARYGKL